MKLLERFVLENNWPSVTPVNLPGGYRWATLRRSPTAFLGIKGRTEKDWHDLVLGRPMPLDPDERVHVRPVGYVKGGAAVDALPTIVAASGVRTIIDRSIEIELCKHPAPPVPGGHLRLLFTHAGNTASLVANESNPPAASALTVARISTRGLRAWSLHARAMSGDTFTWYTGAHDEDTFADPAERPFTGVLAVAAGNGSSGALAVEGNPVLSNGAYGSQANVGNVGSLWLVSTFSAGMNGRFTLRGIPY